jgi:hypothetical protein
MPQYFEGHLITGGRSYSHGWPTIFDGEVWLYADTGEPANKQRPCRRCGRMPTPEGHDACLGTIPGAVSACCGHGVEDGYMVTETAGGRVHSGLPQNVKEE